MSITVLIPTFEEEIHLARCLESVVGWADRVVVETIDVFVDSSNPMAADVIVGLLRAGALQVAYEMTIGSDSNAAPLHFEVVDVLGGDAPSSAFFAATGRPRHQQPWLASVWRRA